MKKYKQIIEKASNEIKLAKRNHWRQLTNNASMKKNARKIWQIVKALINPKDPKNVPLKVNGTTFDTDQERAEVLNEHYAKINNAIVSAPNSKKDRLQERKIREYLGNQGPCEQQEFVVDFSQQELKIAISCLQKRKAPGHDGICPEMLKKLPEAALEWLLEIYNRLWYTGNYAQA